ncbi:uncharacterized protein LOC101775814 [Setaria italica]|uniref:uncharacterized protein LOC101775814 n=1 Tax=Setaria italica TaxID=4555 RepID=UPI000350C816|nr:uncharacterized protein LOC101775814 [Setaria italica]
MKRVGNTVAKEGKSKPVVEVLKKWIKVRASYIKKLLIGPPSRACRTWLRGVLTHPCPLQLPWLLLPYQNAAALPPYATRRASFFCVLCNHAHRVAVPHYTEGARFFGAYPGGWLFLAYGQSCGHGLINLRTHESLYLPDDIIIGAGDGLAWQHPMFIRTATLLPRRPRSRDASPPPSSRYLASASCTFELDAEDVTYHNGAFHFLTRLGNLLLCTPEFQNESPLGRLQVRGEFREMLGRVLNAGARYLVECRGELLKFLRVQPHQEVTWSFRVFRMTQEQVPDADGIDADHARYGWTELPALDGRMLFVGRGCSRSFVAAHFPGSQEGVYFLDDGSFHAAPMICVGDGPRQ